MLPFLAKSKNKMVQTLLDGRGNRTESSGDKDRSEITGDSDKDSELRAACTSVLNAIERKSVPDLMAAIRQAFQECDSEPHSEGPHTNESNEEES